MQSILWCYLSPVHPVSVVTMYDKDTLSPGTGLSTGGDRLLCFRTVEDF